MSTNSAVHLSLEQTVKSFLLGVANLLGKTDNMHSTSLVILNAQVLACHVFVVAQQQVLNLLVVNLSVTDSDGDSLVKLSTRSSVYLVDCSRDDATILEVCRAASHGVSLSGTSLAVAEHCAIVAFDDRINDVGGAGLVGFILTGVVQNLFKLEFPGVGLVVDHTILFSFVHLDGDSAFGGVNLQVFACKIGSGPGANDDFNRLLDHI